MLQRKASKPGQGLGKTTGWIHRTTLLSRGVKMIPGVSYQKIDDDGLHVVINGETQVLAVDNVVICAGQEPNRALAQPLIDSGKTVHFIAASYIGRMSPSYLVYPPIFPSASSFLIRILAKVPRIMTS